MVRRFVVGTAGHIDHGKTALVKALTGVDTDRWEEEKRRGITIDLGFAPLSLGDGLEASVVDVPGHEGFVRNMLAGATGVDAALLVIAADEGLMPQTEEHLAILELLGVRAGIPVIAKADLVDADWLGLVREEITARLAKSRIPWAPPIATSARTGAGLDELRAALARLAATLGERPADDCFRLPIDRVFAVAGAGTVITGTTWSGSVTVGDTVRLLPLGREARIRSIEVHGRSAERAVPGRRTALALVGVDKAELARGDVAVTGEGWAATRAVDVAFELLPDARRPVTAHTRVRIHLGTAEVLGRLAGTATVAPGGEGLARIALERPLVARGGDRFVLRSFSPVTTIGGGVVLDPAPPEGAPAPARRGFTRDEPPAARLARWVAEAGPRGVALGDIPVRLGVKPVTVPALAAELERDVVRAGDTLFSRARAAAGVQAIAAAVREYHTSHPLDPGLSVQAARALFADAAPEFPDLVLETGRRERAFEVEGSVVRRPGWNPAAAAEALAATPAIARRLAGARWEVATTAELEREFAGVPVRAVLAHLVRTGAVEQIDQEHFADRGALEEFRAALEAALAERGAATPAELRERFGLTRKYLIPLLEWADRRGVTRREGDRRVLARLTGGRGGA